MTLDREKLSVHPKCIVFVDAMAHLANHACGKLGFIKGKLPAVWDKKAHAR